MELDGAESYGWWPGRSPLRTRDLLLGSPGALIGVRPALGGRPPSDPHHGLPGDYEFHPVLVAERTDAEVRHAIRRFAVAFRGEWRWSTRPPMNCRLFQLAPFDAVGLVDGTGNYRSRGGGCPALAPLRRLAFRLTGRRRWPTNLPPPGHRVCKVLDVGG